jgi:HD-GYP domain-containing protein (c-di-GMP phosphodiesterase class II)
MLQFLWKKKNTIKILNDVTAINGVVIARSDNDFDEALINSVVNISPQPKVPDLKLNETDIHIDLISILDNPKYAFMTNNGSKKKELIKIIQHITLNNLLVNELEWLKRYEYHYHHTLVVTLMVTRMFWDFYHDLEQAKEAAVCALMHDIGISRIPENILLKVGTLDDEEYAQLKLHPLYSYLLLTYYFGDPDHVCARVALEHHENLQGNGYPRQKIPQSLITKCIQICDIYDALISARPFRQAMPPQQAFDIISDKAAQNLLDPIAFTMLQAYLNFFD